MANKRNKRSKKSSSHKSTLTTAEKKFKRNNDRAVTKLLKDFGYRDINDVDAPFDDINTYTIKSDQNGNKNFINTGINGRNSNWPNSAHIILSYGAEGVDVVKQAQDKFLGALKALFNKNNRKETFIYQPTEAGEFENLKYRKFKAYIDEAEECKIEQVGEEDILENLIAKYNDTPSIDIESIIKKRKDSSAVKPEQIIYFGAPGTGKSYKVNQQVNRKGLLEKEFSDYLHTDKDVHIDAKSADDYCSYCKKFESEAKESFFNYADPLSLEDVREKCKKNWDIKYWGPVLTWYIKFLKKRLSTRIFRTTFHPDYDYCQFVGAYKPKKSDNPDGITYEFVPQVFAKAYASAWRFYLSGNNEPVFLIIEEINRGNCAQIFGDIFQLLDRDEKGFSQYSIECDSDLYEWLKKESVLKDDVFWKKLKLPPNLHILATMNTSDQSLFPMDSAFKRRFDWEYVPISFVDDEGNEKECAKYEIDLRNAADEPVKRNGEPYLWKDFVEKINDEIQLIEHSEDKKLGDFFVKPDKENNVISYKLFLGKVMFYLWNDICKDEHEGESFFFTEEDNKKEYFTFQDLYKKNGKDRLIKFMNQLWNKQSKK